MTSVFAKDALKNKTVFVAGGSSGINLGIAQQYAELGANIIILSRSQDKINVAVKSIEAKGAKAIGISQDVRDYDGILEAFKTAHAKFGDIDCVISGAAGNFLSPVVGLSPNGFKTVVDIDLIGTYNVFHASWEYLAKPGASLIAITARQAVQPRPFQAHACAAKAGVNMLCKCLALEWGQAGVRVNAISPGPIEDTEGYSRLVPTEAAVEKMKKSIPLRAIGTKTDIANIATFLASDASNYVTGGIYNCDGGNELGDASADFLTPFNR